MINIVIPLAGKNQFFPNNDFHFPKPLIEINSRMMIEYVIDNFNMIKEDKQFIFIVNNSDCKKFHLDNILKILSENKCHIIKLNEDTKGAACSAMMAIDYINNDNPLLIANADQIINIDLQNVIDSFIKSDAGVVVFESIHPRWSYVRIDKDNKVIEVAEKKPISKMAIAGFYYFSKGKDFISSSSKMIKKDVNVNGIYYISPTLNELILENKVISIYKIINNRYYTFYSPQKIKEYERSIS